MPKGLSFFHIPYSTAYIVHFPVLGFILALFIYLIGVCLEYLIKFNPMAYCATQ